MQVRSRYLESTALILVAAFVEERSRTTLQPLRSGLELEAKFIPTCNHLVEAVIQ
jgi:hypothetical protein